MSSVSFKAVGKNVGWNLLGNISTFGLKFITVPILARILTPEDFGAIAVAFSLIVFLTMIGNGGLGAALVVKDKEDPDTSDTVFWMISGISVVMAASMYLLAGPFTDLMNAPKAKEVVEVLSLTVPLFLCNTVSKTLLERRMQFARLSLVVTSAEVLSALLAIFLAYQGFGVWSLVAQAVASGVIKLIGLTIAARYVPRFVFHFDKLRALWQFSFRLLNVNIIYYFVWKSPLFFITKNLGLTAAGSYTVPNNFVDIPQKVIMTALGSVMFPAFSAIKHDADRCVNALMTSTRLTALIICPMMAGMAALSDPIVRVMFGEKWLHVIPVMGLIALGKTMLAPCSSLAPYLTALEKTREILRVALARLVIVVSVLIYTSYNGTLIDVLYGMAIINFITIFGYGGYVFHISGQPVAKSLFIVTRPALLSFIMAACVYLLHQYWLDDLNMPILELMIGIPIGAIIYGALVLLFERTLVLTVIEKIRKKS